MGTDLPNQQTRVWLSLAALEDAVHYIKQRPLDDLSVNTLDELTARIYLAAGLSSPEEALVLGAESINRHTDRLKAVITEMSG